MVRHRSRIYTYACIDCGRVVTRKRTGRTKRVCVECGDLRRVAAILSMASKSGPWYDRWKESNGNPNRTRKSTEGD